MFNNFGLNFIKSPNAPNQIYWEIAQVLSGSELMFNGMSLWKLLNPIAKQYFYLTILAIWSQQRHLWKWCTIHGKNLVMGLRTVPNTQEWPTHVCWMYKIVGRHRSPCSNCRPSDVEHAHLFLSFQISVSMNIWWWRKWSHSVMSDSVTPWTVLESSNKPAHYQMTKAQFNFSSHYRCPGLFGRHDVFHCAGESLGSPISRSSILLEYMEMLHFSASLLVRRLYNQPDLLESMVSVTLGLGHWRAEKPTSLPSLPSPWCLWWSDVEMAVPKMERACISESLYGEETLTFLIYVNENKL